jgi:hypothetical protein
MKLKTARKIWTIRSLKAYCEPLSSMEAKRGQKNHNLYHFRTGRRGGEGREHTSYAISLFKQKMVEACPLRVELVQG